MPNFPSNPTGYVFTGNPDTVNTSTLYKPGELGSRLTVSNKEYQLVQLDSGATASTGVGVVAATQLAFWKDKSSYLVTNDLVQAGVGDGSGGADRNAVAGVFRAAITAGNYCYIMRQGRASVLAASAGTWSEGVIAVANSGSAADATSIAQGTAPTHNQVGLVRSARANGVVSCDLNLPEVP